MISDVYKLTPMQEGMLFHSLLEENSAAYFEQTVLSFKGEIDKDLLQKSFNVVVERYDILRTVFHTENVKQPVQIVLKQRKCRVYFEEISHLNEEEQKRYLEKFCVDDRKRGFDLSKDILMRISLLKTGKDSYTLIWSFHHIIMDGWCLGIIIKELFQVYYSLKKGEPLKLEPVVQYVHYIKWLEKQDKEKGLAYWREYLEGYEQPAVLPGRGEGRPATGGKYRPERYQFRIEPGITDRLKELAQKNQVTLGTLFQVLWGILLQAYNNADDVVFGAVVSGRPSQIQGIEQMVGLFINTVPVRIISPGEKTVSQILGDIQERAVLSKSYEYLPLAEIQAGSFLKRELIDHIVVFENYPVEEQVKGSSTRKVPGTGIIDVQSFEQTNYDFNVTAGPGKRLLIRFSFNSSVYGLEGVKGIARHFKNVVDQVVENPGLYRKEIEIVTAEEKHRLLFEFNDTQAAYPENKTIHECFEEQVERTPDTVALVGPKLQNANQKSMSISYRELNKKSDRLAHLLWEKGVRPDTIVGVMLERSVEMIAGLLGILKAGGAYLPIDPSYPGERINYMLADSGARVLLASPSTQVKAEVELVASNMISKKSSSSTSTLTSACQVSPANLAYIIYTSGTTGNPKGVMITHGNVVRLMVNDNYLFDFGGTDVWTMFHSYCFDFSVWEMYGALLYGGKLIVIPAVVARDTETFCGILIKEQVTVLNQTPSAFNNLMAEVLGKDLSLRYIIFGGEALNPGKLETWRHRYPEIKLVNMYGITETTVHVTFKEIGETEIVLNIGNIGRPVPTLTLYVLGLYRKLVPPGVPGELCVGGDGVGVGYLNRVDLTALKFEINPYKIGERIYRSGDLGRRLSGGDLEYLGRIDQQVKIRGFRIEPGEIENRLLYYPGVKDVFVMAGKAQDSRESYLCAYVVSDREFTYAGLRDYLSHRLPEYMIPSYFVQLERLPLTPNGKVDRKALSAPVFEAGKDHAAPGNQREEKLAAIWSEILGIGKEKISIDANFFHLGGHSLKATMVVSRVLKEIGIKIPLAEIFRTPTIRGLSAYIEGKAQERYISIRPVEKRDYYELSPAQKRLYFIGQMLPESTAYNMPMSIPLAFGHPLSDIETLREKLDGVFKRLIRRHESLRTSFHMKDGQPVQRIHEIENYKLQITNYNQITNNKLQMANIVKAFVQPFELSKAPLLRGELLKIGDKYRLLLDMHHIITDATSQQVLSAEFMRLYSGEEPEPLRLQYKDFSQWQNSAQQRADIKNQEDYWLKTFDGDIPVLSLPIDYPRPAVQGVEGGSVVFRLGERETQLLKKMAEQFATTLYMVLLAVYNVCLSRVSGEEDMVVGTAVAGRRHADLHRVVGFFVNTLPLRNFPARSKTFATFLKEVKQTTLQAFENQDYPFEEIVEKVEVDRDTSRNPLFDVMLVLQNLDMPTAAHHASGSDNPGEGGGYRHTVSKFDMTLSGREAAGGLNLFLQYSTALFKRETMDVFVAYFKELVLSAASHPGKTIGEMNKMSKQRREVILEQMNRHLQEEIAAAAGLGYTLQQQLNSCFDKSGRIKAPAIEHNGKIITYGQLKRQIENTARWLGGEKRIPPQSLVGILIEDRAQLIAAMLGVLTAGCVFVPLDSSVPPSRLETMIRTAGIKFLLADRKSRDRWPDSGEPAEWISWDPAVFSQSRATGPPLDPSYTPQDNVYVYFTSGTTGTPRAMMGTNRSLLHFIQWEIQTFGVDESFRFSQFISPVFDAFLRDILVPLCSGGVICIPPDKDMLGDPQELKLWVDKSGITLIHCVPGIFRVLKSGGLTAAYFKGLKYILLSGEKLEPPDLEDWYGIFGARIQLVNLWGPSETTLVKTCYLVHPSDVRRNRIPVGKAMRGAAVVVLDQDGDLCEPLVRGELVILTPFGTAGYLNDPELNRRRFIPLPPGGEPLFKTGDLGYFLPDGNIDMLGRNDRQVKIRGIRVELEEIESVLVKHPSVKEAVVLKKEIAPGNELLCGYITKKSGEGVKETVPDELGEFLASRLPGYMVPAKLMEIDKMPRRPSGKIDYRVLPDPMKEDGSDFQAPRNPVEKKLLELWCGILGIPGENIGINSSFFRLGGNSLNMMSLVSGIQAQFGVSISLKEVFSRPIFRELAAVIMQDKDREERYVSVEPVEEKEYYPLSSVQRRLYFIQQFDPEGTGYVMSQTLGLQGEIDGDKLEKVIKTLIRRHESFRTSFQMVGEEPVQRIHEDVEFAMSGIAFATRPFDLSRAPLLRVRLRKIEKEVHVLMVDMHHIISDGTSLVILEKEFAALTAGKNLPPLKLQYKDYSEWKSSAYQEGEIRKQERYWLEIFAEEPQVLDLPVDYPRPQVRSFEGKSAAFALRKEDTRRLKEMANLNNATLFMVLLAVYNVFLYRLGSEQTIVVGIPMEGRNHIDLKNIIGMFVNTLALKNEPSGEKSFLDFLGEVKQSAVDAFENQEYPFEDLVEKLKIERDTGRNPVFDVVFNLLNQMEYRGEIPEVDSEHASAHQPSTSKFDLNLTVIEGRDDLICMFQYSTRLFRPQTIERFIRYFKRAVSFLGESPAAALGEIKILDKVEKKKILEDFNRTAMEYPRDKTIHGCFEEQVERTPDNIALVGPKLQNTNYKRVSVSYKELNKESDRLARLLWEEGIRPDAVVGIMLEPSLGMIIGILGILKAGGVYLPIDANHPEGRINFILKDSNTKFLLRKSNDINNDNVPIVLNVENLNFEFLRGRPRRGLSGLECRASNLSTSEFAYVIYTSGTTGRPRGVLVEHRGLVNLVYCHREVFGENPDSRVSQVANPAFDAMSSEVWPCLLSGAALYIADNEVRLDPVKMKHWLIRYEITISFQPTVMVEYLLNELWPEDAALKTLRSAGDRLTRFPTLAYPFTLYNLYGPTEDTVWTTWAKVGVKEKSESEKCPPIGKPVGNHRVYIVGANLELQPVGIPGELCIGGVGLAVGYLNRPDLTAEKFIGNPYMQGERMYKTGDLAKWSDDGNIEFIGRMDNQVKIRGFRIELGEIESRLLTHEQIKESVVLLKEGKGDGQSYLCGYIVPVGEVSIPGLREYLSKSLPDYMIPSIFVQLEKIPLTPNGKVDRRALPEPEFGVGGEYTAPANEIEEKLIGIWATVLKIKKENISVNANFFALGGHSIKATVMAAMIHKVFEVKVPLAELFRLQTPGELADFIRQARKVSFIDIEPVEKREFYELSYNQKRLWFIYKKNPEDTAFNMSGIVALSGTVIVDVIKKSLKEVMERHESLRTGFVETEGIPFQFIKESVSTMDVPLEQVDISHMPEEEKERQRRKILVKESRTLFDLSRPPLFRAVLLKAAAGRWNLIYTIHHIISDGWSQETLKRDFLDYYRSAGRVPEIEKKPLDYKDFAAWQNKQIDDPLFKEKAQGFWKEKIGKGVPALQLPTDSTGAVRGDSDENTGAGYRYMIETDLKESLDKIAKQNNTTLFTVMFSSFLILLSDFSNQEEITCSIIDAGREHISLNPIIGFFVQSILFKTRIDAEEPFAGFLNRLNREILEVFEYKSYPLERVCEDLKMMYPDIPAAFNMLNVKDETSGADLVPFEPVHNPHGQDIKFDLEVYITQYNNAVDIYLVYKKNLFTPGTIAYLAGEYTKLMEYFVKNTARGLREYHGAGKKRRFRRPGTGG